MRNPKPDHGEAALLQNASQAENKCALQRRPMQYLGDAHPAPDARVGCAHAPDAGGATCAAPQCVDGGALRRGIPLLQNCEIRTAPVWAGGECGRRHDAINSNVDIATHRRLALPNANQRFAMVRTTPEGTLFDCAVTYTRNDGSTWRQVRTCETSSRTTERLRYCKTQRTAENNKRFAAAPRANTWAMRTRHPTHV